MPALSSGESELAQLSETFAALLGSQHDAMTLYTLGGEIVTLNDAATRLRAAIRFTDLQAGSLARTAFAAAVAGDYGSYEAHVRSNAGAMHLRVDLTAVMLERVPRGVLEIVREPRVVLAADAPAAAIDGLPSAGVLYDRILRLLVQMRRDSRPFAVHLFAVAAETLDEHGLVEEIQRVTARRLIETLRQVDTVGLLGRAFIVAQPEIIDAASVERLTERLVDELREPIAWQGRLHIPRVRVGSVIATRNSASVDELLLEADLALARVHGARMLSDIPKR